MTKKKVTDAPGYRAGMEFAADPATIRCHCSNCDWAGAADQLNKIGDAILTPGDPSPAGRCPEEECDALAYVDRLDDDAGVVPAVLNNKLFDALEKVRNCLSAWVEIANHEDKRARDYEALAEADKLLLAAGRLK